jgi:hypothetical protein
VQGHIVGSVGDPLRSLFWAWLPAGHGSGMGQMIKDVNRISLVCSFAIIQARSDPVWFSPCLVMRHIDGVPVEEWVGGPLGRPPPLSPLPPKKGGRALLLVLTVLTHCQIRRWVWS